MGKLAYVARQPILDCNLDVFGYELLFRDSEQNSFPQISSEEATTKLMFEQCFKDCDSVLGNKLGFINFSNRNLLEKLPLLLPKEKVVIEILEDCQPTAALLEAVVDMKNQGYTLALDDFVPSPEWKSFLPYIDIIKFDIKALPLDKLKILISKMNGFGITFLAEKVETYEEFEHALSIGFELFQGYFFSKPQVIKRRTITPSEQSVLKLCTITAHEEINYKELELIFSSDVSLSFHLLRFVNSARVVNPIKSYSQALIFLGDDNIRRFVSLVALVSVSEKKPDSLYSLSIQRARFCELICQHVPEKIDSSEAFLVGLFSLLDALFDHDFKDIVRQLPISAELKSALVNGNGLFGQFLSLAKACEVGDWDSVSNISSELFLNEDVVLSTYRMAINWSDIACS